MSRWAGRRAHSPSRQTDGRRAEQKNELNAQRSNEEQRKRERGGYNHRRPQTRRLAKVTANAKELADNEESYRGGNMRHKAFLFEVRIIASLLRQVFSPLPFVKTPRDDLTAVGWGLLFEWLH